MHSVWGYIGFAAAVVVVWRLVWWLDPDLRRDRKFETELLARELLTDDGMISRYYASDNVAPEVPAKVRRLFAKYMDYPAEKLLPDDDLTFFWVEQDMVELIKELESEFGITITDTLANQTSCTIRAVSQLVANFNV